MDKQQLTTLEQQISKLKMRLSVDSPNINLIDKIAWGLLNEEVQAIWWISEVPFSTYPTPLLQDEMSLYAQHTWQVWRNNPSLWKPLSESIKIYHHHEIEYQWDLKLHQEYPELSLIKFWLASVNCCCRKTAISQPNIWYKHLLLTQSLLIAQHQQALNPSCLVGYAENRVVIVDLERRQCVIVSKDAFSTFQSSGMTFIHYPYPV